MVKNRSLKIVSLYDCLTSYFKLETLNDEENLRMCEKCKAAKPCEKYQKIESLPPVLVIALKRYYTANSKISTHIQLPSEIDLNEFSSNQDLSRYSLSAIICHRGGLDSGHYVSYCKNLINNVWYKYDDKKVTRKTEAEILNQQAYIAFYTENKGKVKVKTGGKLVPKEWLVRLKVFKNPGQIPFDKYICCHGRLKASACEEDFLKVDLVDWGKYTDKEPFGEIGKCEECERFLRKHEKYLAKEKYIFKELNKTDENAIIPRKWWNTWDLYVKNKGPAPGKINNGSLFQPGSDKIIHKVQVKPISVDAWSALTILYSCDFKVQIQKNLLIKAQPEISKLPESILDCLGEILKFRNP